MEINILQLKEEDLGQTGVARLLLREIDNLTDQIEKLEEFRADYYGLDTKYEVLEYENSQCYKLATLFGIILFTFGIVIGKFLL